MELNLVRSCFSHTQCVFWVSDHTHQIKPSSRALGIQYIFIPCTIGNLAVLGFDSWHAASPSGEPITFKHCITSCRKMYYASERNIHTCKINYLLYGLKLAGSTTRPTQRKHKLCALHSLELVGFHPAIRAFAASGKLKPLLQNTLNQLDAAKSHMGTKQERLIWHSAGCSFTDNPESRMSHT
jgi:hypothetical protein